MQNIAENLTNNPAELKNIIRVLTQKFQEKENELTRHKAESQHQQLRINQLEHQLRLALQFRFGRKSEKSSSPQLALFVRSRKNLCVWFNLTQNG